MGRKFSQKNQTHEQFMEIKTEKPLLRKQYNSGLWQKTHSH